VDSSSARKPDPPFRKWAAKAVVTAVIGVVANAAIITAAFVDGHLTTPEIVQIVIAVAATVVAPYAVFKVENAPMPTRPAVDDWDHG